MNNFPPIDLVYTWVNGDDLDYQRLSQQYTQKKVDLNPERTRDAYTLLRYSLRSVEQFAPWLRNIYIVTCRPQQPTWLDFSHPRLKLIHHDEIFDDPAYLPNFNCNCIESFIQRIPGLSDYFVYLNDDFLFGAPIIPGDFLSPDGKILFYGTFWGEPIPFIFEDKKNDLMSWFQHAPLLIYIPYYEEMLRLWQPQVAQTRGHRFRTHQEVMMHGLYRYYLSTRQRKNARAVPMFKYLKFYRHHKITNDLARQQKGLAKIKAMRPKFYCLNDDQKDQPNLDVVRLVQTFLAEYYPQPSQYEC